MKSGIYTITCLVNNKIYVGSSCNLITRKTTHFRDLSKNKHCNKKLQRSYNKYKKENFIFKILELCEKENLIIKEQYYIDTLKPEFNICKIAGSKKGIKNTDYQKLCVSIANKNKILTQETKDKISQSKKGYKMKETIKEKLRKFKNAAKKIKCVETNEIFNTVTEAALKFNCLHTSISNILNKRSKKIRSGFSFRYLTKEELIASL